MLSRKSWDEYYLDLAEMAASRTTCANRAVGAVVVSTTNRIVSTGYNGGPSGFKHCVDGGCPRANSGKQTGFGYDECIAIHAEVNALLFASPEERQGGTLYTSLFPCFNCAKVISNSGIDAVVTSETYEGYEVVKEFLIKCGVRVFNRPRHPMEMNRVDTYTLC